MAIDRRLTLLTLFLALAAILLVGRSTWTVAAACGWLTTETDKNAPRAAIKLDRMSYDLGEVISGRTVDVTFQVTNVGGQRLILRELDGSCECLSSDRPEILVAPGSTHNLVARLDTSKLCGPMKLELRYRTSDPSQPLVTFSVLADVRQP